MHLRAMTFPFRQHFVYMGVLSQNVKDHFCIVEVVAIDVGSYRQLSTPSVVRMAVRMATMSWMMYLMVSFFIGNR